MFYTDSWRPLTAAEKEWLRQLDPPDPQEANKVFDALPIFGGSEEKQIAAKSVDHSGRESPENEIAVFDPLLMIALEGLIPREPVLKSRIDYSVKENAILDSCFEPLFAGVNNE